VLIIGRTYSRGTLEDYNAVHAIQNRYKLIPLSAYGKFYTPPLGTVDPNIEMKMPVRDQVNGMDVGEFFRTLARLMKDNPTAQADAPRVVKGEGLRRPSSMSKPRKRKKPPKRVLALPDREQAKSAVLNTLTSKSSQRTYDHAITEFVEWYCSQPRLAFQPNCSAPVSPTPYWETRQGDRCTSAWTQPHGKRHLTLLRTASG